MKEWAVWGMCASLNFLSGFLFAKVHGWKKQKKKEQEDDVSWEKLPSGWSRSSGECVGYVMPLQNHAYWWITRKGRTIMEGPAKTLEIGQKEAETALRDFA